MLKTFIELGGTTWKVRRLVDPSDRRWSVFNPSIGRCQDGKFIGLFRSSNYVIDPRNGSLHITLGGSVANRLYFSELDSNFQPKKLCKVEIFGVPFPIIRGIEDAKLYYRDGEWQFTAVIKESEYCPLPTIATFRLLSEDSAELIKIWDLGTNTAEKNWMVPPKNDYFDFIYGPTSIVKDGDIINVRELSDEIKLVRGGSNLVQLDDDRYLAVVHETRLKRTYYYDPTCFGNKEGFVRRYTHMFAVYSKEGVLSKLSDRFCFDGPGIEFASGLVIDGHDLYISYGKKDIRSHIAKIDLDLVLDMLKDV